MKWIQEPEDITPHDACGIHLCLRNEDGSCIFRVCVTRYCPGDF